MNPLTMARSIWRSFRINQGFLWASALTYSTLFAIVPLFAIGLSLFKALGIFDIALADPLALLSEILDPSHKIKVIKYINNFVNNIDAGALGFVGLGTFLMASIPLYWGVEEAINTIWGNTKTRPIHKQLAMSWVMIIVGPFTIILVLSLFSVLNRFIPNVELLHSLKLGLTVFIITSLFFIYKIAPNGMVKTRPALLGATLGGFAWILASKAYQTYLIYATTTFSIYGSLGAIPVFLLWIYINWIIVLFGIQITKNMQYPIGDEDYISPRATVLFKASLSILHIILVGKENDQYFSEDRLTQLTSYPPEIISKITQGLRSSEIILIKEEMIIPIKKAENISIGELTETFIGKIDEDLLKRLSISIPSLSDYSVQKLWDGSYSSSGSDDSSS